MTGQQPEHPEQSDPVRPAPAYGRRALSTRGYVIAAIVPVLIAAGLFGLVVWNYDDSDVQGTPAPLLVSSWQPGQPAGSDPVAGVLVAGEDNCPLLTNGDDTVSVVWPAGFSARVSPGGTLTVYGPDDVPAAREDQEIRATGSLIDVAGSPFVGRPCAPAEGQLLAIESRVQVVG